MSREDIFTIFVEDYSRQGTVLVGYKRFDMEVVPDIKSVFSAKYVSGAIFKVPVGLHTFLLPAPQHVNVSHAKAGSLELELRGSGSDISVFFKPPFGVEPAYVDYYPPSKWNATVVQTIEMRRGDELIVCSKTAEILSAAVYGWGFLEEEIGVKADEEERNRKETNGKEENFWKRLRRFIGRDCCKA